MTLRWLSAVSMSSSNSSLMRIRFASLAWYDGPLCCIAGRTSSSTGSVRLGAIFEVWSEALTGRLLSWGIIDPRRDGGRDMPLSAMLDSVAGCERGAGGGARVCLARSMAACRWASFLDWAAFSASFLSSSI